jgi:serine/threonine protein kinase
MEFEARVYGKYFLLDKIATGGMAEVFKAKTFGLRGIERLMVIKQILPHLTKDREFVEMFIDEAKISVELSHANVVQVFDLGKIGPNYFIAMEYIDGKDLRATLKKAAAEKKPLSVSQVCYIMIELLKGLEYAHKKKDSKSNQPLNIIHRDISPQNIMLSYEGEVKIVDFGIAKAEHRLNETQAGVLKGKFGYMSPEQATGHEMDQRSDLFACGILMFEMLTTRRLFLGENDLETLEFIRAAEVPPIGKYNPDVPKELEAIVYKALQREPDDRFQDARTMQLELTKFMFKYNANFSATDLSTYMKGIFVKEMETEQINLRQALEMIDEKYRLSEKTFESSEDEVSFVHPRLANTETDVTEADRGSGKIVSQSKKTPLADAKTQYQARPTPHNESYSGSQANPLGGTQITGSGQITHLSLIQQLRPWLMPLVLLLGVIFLVWFQFIRPSEPNHADHSTNGGKQTVGQLASIEVSSEPVGSQVFVQNKLYGVTPVSVEVEADKDQTFIFRLGGYQDKSMTVYIAKANNAPLKVILEKIQPQVSSLRITSTPVGASIYLNGEDTGKRTPYTFDGLTPGREVSVKLHKKGYLPESTSINLDQQSIEKTFKLQAQTANLVIETEPSGATIFISGKKIGNSPTQLSVVMDQEYRVTARLKGYQDYSQDVRINDENEQAKFMLQAALVEFGYLSINVDPWAMVYIDGELIGHTPIIKVKVPFGEHEIDFQHTDYGSKKEKIKVTRDNTKENPQVIIRDLKK